VRLITAIDSVPDSPARVAEPTRPPFRVGAVQHRWHPDPVEHQAALAEGVRAAAEPGRKARLPAGAHAVAVLRDHARRPRALGRGGRGHPGRPTYKFAAGLARETGVFVHASLYERAGDGGLGFNTAIVVGPDGALVARTRKLHIPVTAGYYEDKYFRPGRPRTGSRSSGWGRRTSASRPAGTSGSRARARRTASPGAEVLVYPTAIGSEPDHPDFDTQPLWQQVIVANGITNGTFMIAVNRIGTEEPLTFYGSSFISDPYGRVLAAGAAR
jgi:N-carbamoylputrescine amidase